MKILSEKAFNQLLDDIESKKIKSCLNLQEISPKSFKQDPKEKNENVFSRFTKLCNVLENDTSIKTLIFWPRFDAQFAQIFSSVLSKNKTIETICLERHHLGTTGGAYLGLGLYKNKTLKRLNLSCKTVDSYIFGKLRGKGAKVILSGLKSHPTLEHLDLSKNDIDNSAEQSLLEMMMTCPKLEYLDISFNLLNLKNSINSIIFKKPENLRYLFVQNNELFFPIPKSESYFGPVMAKINTKESSVLLSQLKKFDSFIFENISKYQLFDLFKKMTSFGLGSKFLTKAMGFDSEEEEEEEEDFDDFDDDFDKLQKVQKKYGKLRDFKDNEWVLTDFTGSDLESEGDYSEETDSEEEREILQQNNSEEEDEEEEEEDYKINQILKINPNAPNITVSHLKNYLTVAKVPYKATDKKEQLQEKLSNFIKTKLNEKKTAETPEQFQIRITKREYPCYLKDKFSILLYERCKNPNSPFSSNTLPLDIFKMICYFSNLWTPSKKPNTLTTGQILRTLKDNFKIKKSNEINECLVVGIRKGHINLSELLKKEPSEQIVYQGNCNDCSTKNSVVALLKDVIDQPDYSGTAYEDDREGASGFCKKKKCESVFYLTNMCNGHLQFDSGKFHNHCTDCRRWKGKCINDYREQHCDYCGSHYWGGGFACTNCEDKFGIKRKDDDNMFF